MASLNLSKDKTDSVCSFMGPDWSGSSCICCQTDYGTDYSDEAADNREGTKLMPGDFLSSLKVVTLQFSYFPCPSESPSEKPFILLIPACEMTSRNLLFHFQYCMLCLLSFHTRLTSPVTFLGYYCVNTTYNPNSATGSIYRTNLNFVLDTLSSNASRTDTNGFYNFSTGNDPSNKVYGLFLCRGDVSADVCKGCVASATTRVFQECPNQTAAIVWYDECLLRFSDQTIFSKVDSRVAVAMYNTQNVTESNWYNFVLLLGNLLYNAADQAANQTWGKNAHQIYLVMTAKGALKVLSESI
ncbi:putative cysteine-rich receptor-like protein kinase 9 [Coffea eugenioides]|uniref:putative cysteine-rich receptor-like protein kinase 9 n=1 Tax=Coffea eugenioides TaxID=49369 RepID=UPI000F606534|nr:putative cysteine-rich receptor-like protein kinase 9 [Coffea eugenioides]